MAARGSPPVLNLSPKIASAVPAVKLQCTDNTGGSYVFACTYLLNYARIEIELK